MAESETHERSLIEPLYSQSRPNETIVIGTSPITAALGGTPHRGVAQIRLQFSPTEQLLFVAAFEDANTIGRMLSGRESVELSLVDRQVSVKAIPVRMGSDCRFVPSYSVVTGTQPSTAIRRTLFHLFNFPDFSSPTDYSVQRDENGTRMMVRCGRVRLCAGGWAITIAATASTHDDVRALQEHGGWLITHMGEIVREDGSAYTSEQVQEILHCLHFYLSFAMGRWVGLALPVGLDATGKRVFEQWGLPLADSGSWNGSCCWFDDRHGDMLTHVFPGFWRLWNRDPWKDTLGKVIYWYLRAGSGGGVDAGLIMAQTAFELLAWNYCVQDRAMVSAAAFRPRGLSAADKFRLLASVLGIPLEIPSPLRALHAKMGRKWADAMDAITEIRNALVHPEETQRLPDGAYYEAWKLSLWYLDLIILHLCEYSGEYANRIETPRWAGMVEPVPWASKA